MVDLQPGDEITLYADDVPYRYAGTLRREDARWDEETVRESLAIIEEESDRLDRLITNLLNASRIQAGGLRLELADVDLPRLAEKVVARLRVQAGAHDFQIAFPPDFPTVQGDHERLEEVFNNLIGNAIKYSPDGGTIWVGGWATPDQVTVYVADQGIGIPAREQANLFQRFYRVDSSLRRRAQGAGLGLYLCRAIVEAHGGRIWVESAEGQGAKFMFTLPRERGEPPAGSATLAARIKGDAPLAPMRGRSPFSPERVGPHGAARLSIRCHRRDATL